VALRTGYRRNPRKFRSSYVSDYGILEFRVLENSKRTAIATKYEISRIETLLKSDLKGNWMPVAEKRFDSREYWESRLSNKWGLHGVGHISYGRPYNEWLYRVRKRVFLRHVNRLSLDLSQANVLDVGSGTGFWLDIWRSLGVNSLVGSDLTRVAVDHLRSEKPGMDIRQTDITESASIAGMEGRFDIVSAFDVLFHITDEDRFRLALKNVASLLRPGGWFLFSDSFLHTKSKHATHEVDRTLDDFVCELKTNGFEVRTRVPVFVLMNTPIDSANNALSFLWRCFMTPVRVIHSLGHLYGLVLYPFEVFLTQILREGPSTEMMICRKPESSTDASESSDLQGAWAAQ